MAEKQIRGKQGVPGEQGIQGKQGKRGKQGVGEIGKKGDRGRRGPPPLSVVFSFVAVVIVAFLVLTGLAYIVRQNRHKIDQNHQATIQGQKAHDALCAFNSFLLIRVKAQQQFLQKNPRGIPPGTAALIRIQIDNQQQTVNAVTPFLDHCPTNTKYPLKHK